MQDIYGDHADVDIIYWGRLSLSGSQDLISALIIIIGAVLYDSC